MNRMAVDVVLLPERDMAERAVALNRSLVEKYDSDIILNPKSCLPHVSLAMGCIQPNDIQAVAPELGQIIQTNPVSRLYVKCITAQDHHGGFVVSSIELEAREDLRQLHALVMDKLSPYCSSEVTASMFTGEHPIAPSTLNWVKNFAQASSGEKFWPHITLGYGPCDPVSLPASFAPRALALCHLGNHCTCRKVLCQVTC